MRTGDDMQGRAMSAPIVLPFRSRIWMVQDTSVGGPPVPVTSPVRVVVRWEM
jgi:hypothetical protein